MSGVNYDCIVSFKIDRHLLSRLDKYALKHKMTRSEVIRQAIREFLDRREPKAVKPKVIRIFS